MKNLLLSLLMLLFVTGAIGQSREVSLSLSAYQIETSRYYIGDLGTKLDESTAINNLFNIGLGYYIPLFEPAPNIGAGINAGGTFGIRFASDAAHEVFGELAAPVVGMLRFGAGSTREAYFPLGIGLGAGCRLAGVVCGSGDPFYEKEDPVIRVMFAPYLVGELVLDYQKRGTSFFDNFKIQYAIQPVQKKVFYDPEVGEDINNWIYFANITFIKFLPID